MTELVHSNLERAYLKIAGFSVAGLALLIGIIWGGLHVYNDWQGKHLVRRAAAVMTGGDLKTASLSVRRALQLNPQNIDAARLMAQIAQKSGDRTAVEWRRKVAELNPASTADVLALAQTALWANDIATADKTLASLATRAAGNADYHAAAAAVAGKKNDLATAEAQWMKAVELAPNDPGNRLQLALVRLSLPDAQKQSDALHALEELRNEPTERAAATRTLIINGVARRGDPQRIVALAQQLQTYPDALFSDQILYLELLRQTRSGAYEEYLAQVKQRAASNPADLTSLLSWMIRSQMATDALAFSATLPPATLTKWPVPVAFAEAHAQAKEWTRLEKLVREGDWSGYDFLRRAYLSRALRGEGKELAAKQEFSNAQNESAANPQMLTVLTQLMAEWGWQEEAVELLWVLTKNPATRQQALHTLYDHYIKVADTPGLYRTLAKFAELDPHDAVLQNNLAQISLLIGADVDHARKLAADLKAKDATNPAFQSTYAFSLLSKGDVKGALKVMDGLSEEQLRDPSVATYYGLVLAAAGQKEKAKTFLRRSSEAKLLPEEKALVAKAESSLN